MVCCLKIFFKRLYVQEDILYVTVQNIVGFNCHLDDKLVIAHTLYAKYAL